MSELQIGFIIGKIQRWWICEIGIHMGGYLFPERGEIKMLVIRENGLR